MCIGGTSIVFQLVLLNCCHAYPVREIPGWLKTVQGCISCGMGCANKPRENEVQPYPGGNGHLDKHVLETENQNVHSTQFQYEDPKTEPLPIRKNSATHPKMITKDININQDEAKLRLEWKKLAGYLDRLFVFIFATIHLFMILFIFVVVPSMYAWKG